MKRLLLLPVSGLVLAVTAAVLLLVSNLYTWHRLTLEAPIAELEFTRTGPGEYEAVVAWGDFCTAGRYRLFGDQWRLDARFLKWRPWANLLGFDALYRLERLGGRYRAAGDENSGRHLAHDLDTSSLPDLATVMARYGGPFSPVDTFYGSSVYMDMDEQYLYRVYRGQSGLLVRREPRRPAGLAGEGITIEINTDCKATAGKSMSNNN